MDAQCEALHRGGNERAEAQIIQIDTATGVVTRLADVLANAGPASLSVSCTWKTIAYLCSKPDAPANVWVPAPVYRVSDQKAGYLAREPAFSSC
jgi:hypothetical protein